MEIYSIDEAFLSLDPGKRGFEHLGHEIKDKIRKNFGLPLCVGIANTKVLAKLANRLAKKSDKADGVVNLYESPFIDVALKRTKTEDIWGIGSASRHKLLENRVTTALHLRDVELRWARKLLTVTGARVVLELRGVSCFPLESQPINKQSITSSRTFGEPINHLRELREAVSVFLHRATDKMRRAGLAARTVTVFVSTDRFNPDPYEYSNSSTYSSNVSSDATLELQAWAMSALERIFRPGFAYRKAGVVLMGLTPADKLTVRMFDDERWERFRRVQKAVDEINRRWGSDTVRLGLINRERRWEPKAARLSPRYTTRFDEILQIK